MRRLLPIAANILLYAASLAHLDPRGVKLVDILKPSLARNRSLRMRLHFVIGGDDLFAQPMLYRHVARLQRTQALAHNFARGRKGARGDLRVNIGGLFDGKADGAFLSEG